jgi:2,3-bisphosphoglycerate-independent phosphoglycerate mutase
MLIIMDGWGINQNPLLSAIQAAKTPFTDNLYLQYPNTALLTHGEYVGLPADQMGNSEVGHMNLGAGRVVYQELLQINKAIENGSFAKQAELRKLLEYCKTNNKPLHLMGLVSDGGVHSHINHLKAICDIAQHHGLCKEQVLIHVFSDGRDTDPRSGLGFVAELESHLQNSAGRIASVCGRYYAMDRDKRWERVKLAYDLLTAGKGEAFTSAAAGIEASYQNNITDEFIKPVVITENDKPIGNIQADDAVLCFNFRTDRCREITQVLTQKDMPEQGMKTLPLYFATMTIYDDQFKNIKTIYGKVNLQKTLGEVISENGLTQLRIAETEKYPHVTFFFSGGREQNFPGEERIMIPSPKVATYDLQPEMSANEVKDAVIRYIDEKTPDFICLNFANTDMVGHTGVFTAAIKAAETVDRCVQEVVQKALEKNYCIFLTADHGNADYMVNEDGSPNTSHTKNIVPLFVISNHFREVLQPGKLADIAPTILRVMNLPVPEEMDGNVLL